MVPSIVKKKILCSMIIAACLKKKKKKRIWCKDWLKKRIMYGSTATILHELQSSEEHDFRNYLRMNVSTFYILLSKVELLTSVNALLSCIHAEIGYATCPFSFLCHPS